MEEIHRALGAAGRARSESAASDATQSTGGRLALRQRLLQLMTCVDHLEPEPDLELDPRLSDTLDRAFLVCGRKAHAIRKDRFRLHMVTWNVSTADPPDELTSLLHLNSPKHPDLYVIGLQEVYSGPVRYISDMAFDDAWSHMLMASLSPRGYLKVSSVRLQGLLLLVFSKRSHVPFIRDIQATYTRTGIFGYWGNKGGVSVRLSFYGHMMCFLNCHLAAHMQYALERVDEFEHILDTQSLHPDNTPRPTDHRLLFWFGDLNFRIQDHGMHFVRSCINSHSYNLLWSKDQLTMMKKKEALLQEFEEGPLDFPPTYKFDKFSDNYDSSGKKRKPAWTDRILWRLQPKAPPPQENQDSSPLDEKNSSPNQEEEEEEFPLKMKQDVYTSVMEYGVSDHKPVLGLFTLELKKMYDTPLVRVTPEGEWCADFDAMVIYSPLQHFPSSAWDWIGLYRVDFTSISDYITYVWVKDDQVSFNEELIQVYVDKAELPVRGAECVLCYYCSTLRCIVGISSPFKVHESKVAIEEGLAPENINGLDKATAS